MRKIQKINDCNSAGKNDIQSQSGSEDNINSTENNREDDDFIEESLNNISDKENVSQKSGSEITADWIDITIKEDSHAEHWNLMQLHQMKMKRSLNVRLQFRIMQRRLGALMIPQMLYLKRCRG